MPVIAWILKIFPLLWRALVWVADWFRSKKLQAPERPAQPPQPPIELPPQPGSAQPAEPVPPVLVQGHDASTAAVAAQAVNIVETQHAATEKDLAALEAQIRAQNAAQLANTVNNVYPSASTNKPTQ